MKVLYSQKCRPQIPHFFYDKFSIEFEQIPKDFCNKNVWQKKFFSDYASVYLEMDNHNPESTRIVGAHSSDVVELANLKNGVDGAWRLWKQHQDPVCFALSTADCLAVSIVTQYENEIWGTLFHAGWRGYTGGIHHNAWSIWKDWASANNIDKKELLNKTHVFISPAIFGENYECGSDVYDALVLHQKERLTVLSGAERDLYSSLWNMGKEFVPNKIHPDLQLMMALECLVVLQIPSSNICLLRENTFDHERLPSYRFRTLHGGNAKQRLFTHLKLGKSSTKSA